MQGTNYYTLPDTSPAPSPLDALRALLAQNTLPGPTPQFQTGAGGLVDQYARAANGQAPLMPGAALSQGALPMIPQAAPAASPQLAALQSLLAQNTLGGPTPNFTPSLPGGADMFAPAPMPVPGTGKKKGKAAQAQTQDGMPTAPKGRELPMWAKVLAGLSTAAGGPGAQIAHAYLNAGGAKDQAQYQQQFHDWQQRQATAQQDLGNAHAAAQVQGALVDRLSGLDPDSQQQYVGALAANPDGLQAYGYTPETLHAQFYDAQGQFQPVGTVADAKDASTQSRAQTQARTQLFGLAPDAQQNLHDSYLGHADEWETAFGIPYDQFKPGQTQKDVTAGKNADTRAEQAQALAGSRLSTAQTNFLRATLRLNPQQQALMHSGMDPTEWEQKTGIPYAAFQPGMTERDTISLMGLRQRAILADQSNATRRFGITTASADRRAGQAVTERGQDLAHNDRQAGLQQSQARFQSQMAYKRSLAAGGDGVSGLKLQQVIQDRETARKELQRLRAEGQALSTNYKMAPDVKQSQMDDIAAQTKQAQDDYNSMDTLYQAAMKKFTPAPSVAPNPSIGRGQPPKAPNTRTGKNAYAPAAGLGSLPPFPVGVPGNSPFLLTGAGGIGTQSAKQVAQIRALGGSVSTAAPRQPAGGVPRVTLNGTYGKSKVEFHGPISKQEFDSLTPTKKLMYLGYLKKAGKI